MATSSLPQRPASSCSTSARLLPSDSAIFRVYVYELNQRERGAVTRTAAALGVSKQHVSNVLRRHQRPTEHAEQAQHCGNAAAENLRKSADVYQVDDLAYVPPPGAEELAQERARLHAQMEAQLLLTSLLVPDRIHNVSTPVNETASVGVNDSVKSNEAEPLTLTTDRPLSTAEREYAPVYVLRRCPRLGPTAQQQEAVIVSRIAIGVAALLTLGVLLLASRSTLAGLGMLPAALVAWSIVAEGRRVVRLG